MTTDEQAYIERAERFPLSLPLRYHKSGLPEWREGKTINISRTGILFSAGESLPVDSELEIRVQFPRDATLSCLGSVVRSHALKVAVRIDRSTYSRPASG